MQLDITLPPTGVTVGADTYRKVGSYLVCQICGLAVPYCRGGHQAALVTPSPDDQAGASLDRRIADCKGAR
jgi:hypothetical protein